MKKLIIYPVIFLAASLELRAQTCLQILCGPNKTVVCGAAWSFDTPTVSVNCCSNSTYALSVVSTITNFTSCTNQFITQTWGVSDQCGHTNACSQTVQVVKTNAPVFLDATNITVFSCTNVAVFYSVTATQVCCGILPVICVPPSGSTFSPGSTQVQCIASNCCGRAFTDSFVVTVVNTNVAVFQGVSPVTIQSCGPTPVFYNPTASEVCCGPLPVSCNPPSGSTFGFGTTVVSCTTTDCFGSVFTTNLTVTVLRGESLIPVCADKSVVCGTSWTYDPPTIYDPCCSDTNYTVITVGPVTNGVSACGQTNTMTFIVTDQCGNSNQCSQTVTILNPLVLYPTNYIIACGSPIPTTPPTFTAGCCTNVTFVLESSFTNISGCGETIYQVWQATDCCSNSLTATNLVTVQAGAPDIVCAGNKTLGSAPCSLGSGLPGYTLLHNFPAGSGDGLDSQASLLQASDHNFYGTTTSGGTYNQGTVFVLSGNLLQFMVLYSFGGTTFDGSDPVAGLIEGRDGYLYGTTLAGGQYGHGTVFKIQKSGLGYSVLHSFGNTATDGRGPAGTLVQASNGNLYGTTSEGGAYAGTYNPGGTVFAIHTNGGFSYQVLYNFGNPVNPDDGQAPLAGLVIGTDNLLYGTTESGGTGGLGTIFKLSQGGTGYAQLYSFTIPSGYAPRAPLVFGANGALFGTASIGGANYNQNNQGGVVFTIQTNGNNYAVLYNFGSFAVDGNSPYAGLLVGCDQTLYGTTAGGGTSSLGTVFTLRQDGSAYAIIKNFTPADGDTPYSGLIQGTDGNLYGTTTSDGANTNGTVFVLPPALSGLFDPPTVTGGCCGTNISITVLSTVSHSTPCGVAFTRTWQVVACCGQSNFCTQTVTVGNTNGPILNCSNLTINCGSPVPTNPPTALGLACSNVTVSLVGTFTNLSDCAQILSRTWRAVDCCGNANTCLQTVTIVIPPPVVLCPTNKAVSCGSGPAYVILRNLLGVTDGAQPFSALLSGNNGGLFGTAAYGGAAGGGTVFAMNPDGSGYQVLHNFGTVPDDGEEPVGLCQDQQGVLYGTSFGGGTAGFGTVFKMAPDGSGYVTLYSFGVTPRDGLNPAAGVVLGADGELYGTTLGGGDFDGGTVFKLGTDGSGYQVLYSFGNGAGDGTSPAGTMLQASDAALYGTTSYGGGPTEAGTVFAIRTDGSGYAVLHAFGNTVGDGINPLAGLIQTSDGKLYGTTVYGGTSQSGTLFRLDTNGGGYAILHQFSNSAGDGIEPESALVMGSDGVLYGTAFGAGSQNAGVLFRLNADGTGYSLVHTFGTVLNDGSGPLASLVTGHDGALYGTAAYGGVNGDGLIYRLPTTQVAWDFDPPVVAAACCPGLVPTVLSTVTNGSCPQSITRTWLITDCCSNSTICTQTVAVVVAPPVLVCANITVLAGSPALTNPPTVLASCCTNVTFSLVGSVTNANGCTNIIYQNWLASDCCGLITNCPRVVTVLPSGPVFFSSTTNIVCGTPVPTNPPTLYDPCCTNARISLVTTVTNGSSCGEVIYQTWQAIDCNSNSATATRTINVSALPPVILYPSNKTVTCGSCASTTTSSFTLLHSFPGTSGDGLIPGGGLLLGSDGALYGSTVAGGLSNYGTVFAVGRDGSNYRTLKSFLGNDGQDPLGALVDGGGDGTLYGTTALGGTSNRGTVFSLSMDGTSYQVLKNFSGTDGSAPDCLLVGSDGLLYGATQYGGTSNYGTIFRLGRDGTGYVVLHSFTDNVGYNAYAGPYVGLLQGRDGALYGTTAFGGAGGKGTIFRLNTNSTGYTVIHSFNGTDGQTPLAQLLQASDGALYGTTFTGASGNGLVFTLNTSGQGYSVLHSFAGATDGCGPLSGLLETCDGALYGMTFGCGGGNGGVVFKLNKDGTGFTLLQQLALTVAQGDYAIGALVDGHDGALYGATAYGGSGGGGVIFGMAYGWTFDPPVVLSSCCAASPNIALVGTATNTLPCGRSVTATWTVTDCCSNTITCTQTVTVVSPPPTLLCPSNIVVVSCTNTPVFFPNTLSGNACCTNLTASYSPPSGTVFAQGTTNLIQCTATDCCGHTNTCVFEVMVVPPTVSLSINRSHDTITLTWTGGGVLEEASTVTGPWTQLAAAFSPYTVPANQAAHFYRLRCH